MEVVTKSIELEPAKNRFYNNFMKALDSETLETIENIDCWGDFPYDVVIDSGDEFDMFKLGEHLPMLLDGDHYIFRFGNIANIYGWLNRIEIEAEFYKLSVRQGKNKWVKTDIDFYEPETLDMYSKLPGVNELATCDIICVHPEAELFNQRFRLSGETTRYEINFKNFVEKLFSGTSGYEYSSPYVELPIVITEDVNSVGDLLSDEQTWQANKKYYVGDIVRYEDDYYTLVKASDYSTFEVSGNLYSVIDSAFSGDTYNFISEIPSDLSELSNTQLNVLYTETDTLNQYKIILPYYKGYYNTEKKITVFDEDNTHWRKISTEEYGESDETNKISASKLKMFRSVRKSYDFNNNELPFNVINELLEDHSDIIRRVALIYTLGYTNYVLKGDGACVDFLEKVEFLKNLSDEEPLVITYNENGKTIFTDDLIDGGYTYVRFTYYSGCEVIDNGDEQTVSTGGAAIKYTETRRIELTTVEIQYDSPLTETFRYFSVNSTSEESRYGETNDVYAKVEYTSNKVDSIPFHIFSNDKIFGSAFIEYEQGEIDITRGSYGAFERHNIMGEINSMDDLENYRNNYFKL